MLRCLPAVVAATLLVSLLASPVLAAPADAGGDGAGTDQERFALLRQVPGMEHYTDDQLRRVPLPPGVKNWRDVEGLFRALDLVPAFVSSPSAEAAKITFVKRAAIWRLFEAQRMGENWQAMRPALEKILAGSKVSVPRAKEVLDELYSDRGRAQYFEAYEDWADRYFSTSEIEMLTRFYGSPLGQRYVGAISDFARDQSLGVALMKAAMQRVDARHADARP